MDYLIDKMLVTTETQEFTVGIHGGSLHYSFYFCACLKFSMIKTLKIFEKKKRPMVYYDLGSLWYNSY